MLTELKKQEETAWLCDVSSVPLQQALRHLDKAFTHFFKGHGKYPNSKRNGINNRLPMSLRPSTGMEPRLPWQK